MAVAKLKAQQDCKVDPLSLKVFLNAVKSPQKMSYSFMEALVGFFTGCCSKKSHRERLQDRIMLSKANLLDLRVHFRAIENIRLLMKLLLTPK